MLRRDPNHSGAFYVHFQTSVPLVNKIGKLEKQLLQQWKAGTSE